MGFKKVAELVIQEDRLTVSSILIKNGYTVGPDKRKRTPTGKTLDYLLNVYEEDSGAKEGQLWQQKRKYIRLGRSRKTNQKKLAAIVKSTRNT